MNEEQQYEVQELPLILRVLAAINELLGAKNRKEWKIGGVDTHTWGHWINWDRGEPPYNLPKPGSLEAIANTLWNKHLEVNATRRAEVLAIIHDLDRNPPPDAKLPKEISKESLYDYFLALRARTGAGPIARRSPNETQTILPRYRDIETPNTSLYTSFWKPLLNKQVAIAGVWAQNHHYDLVPMCLLAGHVASFYPEVHFLYFGDDGKPLLPADPQYDKIYGYCFLGRPGLYTSSMLYDSNKKCLLPPACFTLPAVTEDTKRHLKRQLDPRFHRVNNHVGRGLSYLFAEDVWNDASQERTRTDYATIQRFFIPEKRAHVVILAGCTALGTLVAVQQATRSMFSRVEWRSELATEDNVEILLEVTGTMQWSARDQQELEKSQEKGQTAKLLTKPWLSIRSVPWLFCVNNKVIHHNDYAIEGSASPARRLRSQFVEKLDTLKTRYRYNTSKYSTLLGRKWPAVRRIVEGKPQLEVIKDATARVSYVEVHPCEPCQLGCAFCRGQLRMPAVPKKHEQKSDLDILGVIMRIREMNPLVFIRFSGTIGEPLLHKQIAESFRFLSKNHRHHWGVTTNGLLLGEMDYLETLMGAAYVHISLDAGSDKTYQRLKNGKPGHFDKVINNIQNLHSKKTERMPEIVVSFLLQDENYHEIRSLSNILKRIGTNTFEIKMQHYHPDRIMSAEKLRLAYQDIKRIQLEDSPTFQVIAVQSEFEAEKKIGLSPEAEQWSEASNPMSVEFARCYANELGLNATIDPRGRLQTCCQYYQDTLGIQAEDWRQLSPDFWTDSERAKTLAKKPHDVCKNCSPSDEVVNGFVKFLCDAQGADRRFLEWVENFFVEYEVGTADKKIPACS